VVVQAAHGTVMLTVTARSVGVVEAEPEPQETAVVSQIIDIETFQLLEHTDKDFLVVLE
jgi:hypothetical protein